MERGKAMLPENTAFIFPGQGSQFVGMGNSLADQYPAARQVFAQADDWLGFEISRLAWEGPEESLNDTINTQPALMVHSVAALHVFLELIPGFLPLYIAGHSMGELSALVAASALPFREALSLVRRRGELMKRAGVISPGGMAAIMGLDIPTLDDICNQASAPGEIVQVANDNCPGQVVISGASAALERALPLAQEARARRVVRLPISIAAHSPLMENSQDDFIKAVASAPIQDPVRPIIGNVSAQPMTSAADIKNDLCAQLTSRVRWTESIQYMITQGVNTFIELGSGSVLAGLIRRIDREVTTLSLGKPEDFEKILNA
jgi:[acyl-carrier-protein] S-malonyltransferase